MIRKGVHVGIGTSQRHPVGGDIFVLNLPPEGIIFCRLWSYLKTPEGDPAASDNRFVLRAEQPDYPEAFLSIEVLQ